MSIHYLSPLRRPPEHSLVGQVYRQIKQEFGVIADPFQLHAPVPELLAGLWSVTREVWVVPAGALAGERSRRGSRLSE